MTPIRIEHLSKVYRGKRLRKVHALDDVSFTVEAAPAFGFLGPNGAGKTTLLRILVAFLEPDSGEITIDGLDISQPLLQQKIKGKIGYLPESAPLYDDMTVSAYLIFTGKMQGIKSDNIYEKLAEVIEKCGLKEKKNAEIMQLNCDAATGNLEARELGGNRMYKTADGEYLRLSGEERQHRIDQAKQQMEKYCTK